MGRVIVAGIVGMIILFAWSATWWMGASQVLVPHKPVENGDAIRSVLSENINEQGFYWIPTPPVPMTEEDAEGWMEQHEEGPVGFVVFTPEGRPVMAPILFIRSFVIMLISSLLAAAMLASITCGRAMPYARRVGFVFGLGVFAAITIHAIEWNFMGMPTAFTLFKIGDVMIGWLLVGLVMGAIVKGGCAPKAA